MTVKRTAQAAPAAPKPAARNTHSVAVHIGDGRKIEPGAAIPADVTGDTLKALLASGFFA